MCQERSISNGVRSERRNHDVLVERSLRSHMAHDALALSDRNLPSKRASEGRCVAWGLGWSTGNGIVTTVRDNKPNLQPYSTRPFSKTAN